MRIFKFIKRALFYFLFHNRFKKFSVHSLIDSPLRIDGMKNISISKGVVVQYKTWLAAVPLAGNSDCILEIGEGSIIGNFNHIYATSCIKIGKNVLTADKVFIIDNSHSYSNISVPIMHQPIKHIGDVEIGDGSWLGENVCILGVSIGRNCIIGSNSVVTRDIPDYCIAVGSPAKIIKRYNHKTKEWQKV